MKVKTVARNKGLAGTSEKKKKAVEKLSDGLILSKQDG